jgi:hypothetical protein
MDANEVFRFILALALAPAIVTLGRRIRLPRARAAFLVAYAATVVAFGGFVANSVAPSEAWRILIHVGITVAGLGIATAAYFARRIEIERSGAGQ